MVATNVIRLLRRRVSILYIDERITTILNLNYMNVVNVGKNNELMANASRSKTADSTKQVTFLCFNRIGLSSFSIWASTCSVIGVRSSRKFGTVKCPITLPDRAVHQYVSKQ